MYNLNSGIPVHKLYAKTERRKNNNKKKNKNKNKGESKSE